MNLFVEKAVVRADGIALGEAKATAVNYGPSTDTDGFSDHTGS